MLTIRLVSPSGHVEARPALDHPRPAPRFVVLLDERMRAQQKTALPRPGSTIPFKDFSNRGPQPKASLRIATNGRSVASALYASAGGCSGD
jgi:hypothetical protein